MSIFQFELNYAWHIKYNNTHTSEQVEEIDKTTGSEYTPNLMLIHYHSRKRKIWRKTKYFNKNSEFKICWKTKYVLKKSIASIAPEQKN